MITIEDGTGLPNANSYASVADLTAYATDRGITLTGTTAQQTSALIRATDYLDATFRAAGDPLEADQGLQWPRAGASSLDARVKRATIVLAIEALAGPLGSTPDRGIKSEKKALEGLGSTETVYDDAKATSEPYPIVAGILAPLLASAQTVTTGRVIR